MKGLPAETDFVVIGASVAGLRAAIELAPAGRVLLLNKKEIPNFAAVDAKSQASWLSDEDDVSLHLQDTLNYGDGLCNVAAVKLLLEEGQERIDELIAWEKATAQNSCLGLRTRIVGVAFCTPKDSRSAEKSTAFCVRDCSP